MKGRGGVAVFCWLLIITSCTPNEGSPQGGAASPAPGRVGVFDVVRGCNGLGTLRKAQLSFVSEGEMFVARPGASVARCTLEIDDATDLEWGPAGDRLHFGDLRRYEGNRVFSLESQSTSPAWSRPTGTSIVFISTGRLMKVEAFGDKPRDISFLRNHDQVVYHPAGTHIAVTGTSDDGTYGVWLATNVGEEPQLLAIGEDARRIFSMGFGHGGTTLYYAAEHDERYDVHALRLASQDAEGNTRDAELATLDSSPGVMGDVVVSEFAAAQIAYTVGSCEEGKRTRVWNGAVTEIGGELAEGSTEPVGWLPTGELLLLARQSGCVGDGTLYLWHPDDTTRLVAGVSAAGVRAALPPPPDPPDSDQQVIA